MRDVNTNHSETFHITFFFFQYGMISLLVWDGELDGDDERLADFRLKCHPHLHAVLPGFD
jgi:hypothetical protein